MIQVVYERKLLKYHKEKQWVDCGLKILNNREDAIFYGWLETDAPQIEEPFVPISAILGEKPTVEVAHQVVQKAAMKSLIIIRFKTNNYPHVNAYPLSFLVDYFSKKHPELAADFQIKAEDIMIHYFQLEERRKLNPSSDSSSNRLENCGCNVSCFECDFPF